MAINPHTPRRTAHDVQRPGSLPHRRPELVPRGLAIWIESDCIDETMMARAAEVLLARALKIASEAEVHLWPASEAANFVALPGAGNEDVSAQKEADATRPTFSGRRTVAVDLAAETVLVDGQQVPLTGVEYRLVRYLAENCSRPIRREELRQFLETLDFPRCALRSIDVYVGRLRRKLGGARHVIVTVRGGGYQFTPGPQATIRGPTEYAI